MPDKTSKKIKLSDIHINPDNPRLIKDDKFKKLVASIKDFPKMMFLRPIVIDDTMTILGGNMRYKALQEAGFTEIPDEWVKQAKDLTEEEKKRFVIEDNMPFGEWDWDILANNFEIKDLLEWGFDEKELKIEQDIEEDEAPEVSDEPAISKLGEVYQLGRHRLMCGDSTKIEDVEKLMDGKKADMVFTDPPYGIDFQSNMRTKSEKFDVLQNDDVLLTDWIASAVTFSTGWVLFCTTWKVLDKWLEIGKQIGELSNMIIWDKGGGGIGDLEHSLLTDYEVILAYNRKNKIIGKRIGSVWSVGKDSSMVYDHPTQKPVELSALAIRTFSNGSVLDLFGGSGSTLIACEQTNRICYMMEIDPKYCDVIRKRYAKFIGKEDEWKTL